MSDNVSPAVSLMRYGYSQNDIAVEFPIHIGSMRKRVDLAIFPPESEHAQQNISIVVECKRERVKPHRRGQWRRTTALVRRRLHALPLWHVGRLRSASLGENLGWGVAGGYQYPPVRLRCSPSTSIRRPCASRDRFTVRLSAGAMIYIYGNQGLQKEPAFNELLKLHFLQGSRRK